MYEQEHGLLCFKDKFLYIESDYHDIIRPFPKVRFFRGANAQLELNIFQLFIWDLQCFYGWSAILRVFIRNSTPTE